MQVLANIITWTLIHTLWVGFLLWFIVRVIEFFSSKSDTRRLVKTITLVLFILATFVLFYQEIPNANSEANWMLFEKEMAIDYQFTLTDKVKIFISEQSHWISIFWLLGASIGLIRTWNQKNAMNKIQVISRQCLDERTLGIFEKAKSTLRIKENVLLKTNSIISSPMTYGFIKPIIYLPFGLATGLTDEELETIFLHELTHIKHNDFLINLILISLETIFFFNPFVIMLTKSLRTEMEYSCDDQVLAKHNEILYAKTLVKLEEFNLENKLALKAKGNNTEFSNRIQRMVQKRQPQQQLKGVIITSILLVLLFSSAFVSKTIKQEEPNLKGNIVNQDNDTLRFDNKSELQKALKGMKEEDIKGKVILLNGEKIRIITGRNSALEKADKMMKEINAELIKDGLLNENRQKMTLMFQYSDLLNGKANLGDKYEKYKAIFNRYFPVYDSFATTRVFRYKK